MTCHLCHHTDDKPIPDVLPERVAIADQFIPVVGLKIGMFFVRGDSVPASLAGKEIKAYMCPKCGTLRGETK